MSNNFIYLLQLPESEWINNKATIKIGRTKQEGLKRVSEGYPKNSKLILQIETIDCIKAEKYILENFKNKFKLIKGREFFQVNDYKEIDFMKCFILDYIKNENLNKIQYLEENERQNQYKKNKAKLILYEWIENNNFENFEFSKFDDIYIDYPFNDSSDLLNNYIWDDKEENIKCNNTIDILIKHKGYPINIIILSNNIIDKNEIEKYNNLEYIDKDEIYFINYNWILEQNNIPNKLEFLKLNQKEITYDLEPELSSLNDYDNKKIEFEKRNFLVGNIFVNIHQDGYIEYMKLKHAKIRNLNNTYKAYNHMKDKIENLNFFKKWLKDTNRSSFDRMDFIPDLENCPKNVYNIFKGFKNINLKFLLLKNLLMKKLKLY